ncbi:carbohydrate-binding module family 1 protein [Jaapia argillacea MUCL 33604]|uniref:cellulase n=1 Tax=Jaapia argillacea MUCL 33604 TaxID=933084 RepID=A0A067Q1A0_9AGAM|nr:carbohydrate-binding module family 1 protein [Jaapia argillacea MUCL 33604]
MRGDWFPKAKLLTLFAYSVRAQAALYGQCGGLGWTGSTTCVSGTYCSVMNAYYSQCLPIASTVIVTTTVQPTSSNPTTTPTTLSTTSSAPAPSGTGTLRFVGVNIAGFDFGCSTNGTYTPGNTEPPLAVLDGADGVGQMTHYYSEGFNVFRLPVCWQYLTDGTIDTVDSTNFARYDTLVKACLATGAYCIIDLHNYARFNGQVIGQGGPTNAQFADIWSFLAAEYAPDT